MVGAGLPRPYGESSPEGGFPAVGDWRTRRVTLWSTQMKFVLRRPTETTAYLTIYVNRHLQKLILRCLQPL